MAERTAELDKLWADFKATGSVTLRNRLIEEYLPLVRRTASIILRRLPDTVELDELVSYGVPGLMGAIKSFDPSRGYRFCTLATKRIYGAILDGLRNIDWMPRVTRDRIKRMAAAAECYAAEHGRAPTRDELRQRLRLGVDGMKNWERSIRATSMESLSRKPHDAEGKEFGHEDALSDSGANDPADAVEVRVTAGDIVAAVVREFTVTEALILRLRYLEGETFREIGLSLGNLGEATMCFRHRALLIKLKERFAPDTLSAFVKGAA